MTDSQNDTLNKFINNNNAAIYQFNKAYTDYISQCIVNNGDINKCDNLLSSINNQVNLYRINYFNPTDQLLKAVTSSGTIYKNDQHQQIMQKYKDLSIQRTELDNKLKELYDIPGSKSLDYKYNYDSTIYSGILVTIIASGIIYYTFTRL